MKTTLTVRELYELTPEKIVSGRDVIYYTELISDHLIEETEQFKFSSWEYAADYYHMENIPDDFPIEVRYLKEHCFDGRRTWVMAIAYWRNVPFCIYKNYGRDNDEYTEHYITNREVMNDFIDSLNKYKIIKKEDIIEDVLEDEEISVAFYNANLLDEDTFVYYW